LEHASANICKILHKASLERFDIYHVCVCAQLRRGGTVHLLPVNSVFVNQPSLIYLFIYKNSSRRV